ncbi:helix-turn-helix domain-containing protein [Dehalococcoidia bacterium]|nr:helix-turn-helix domain-containing protein [Dehalococcoidia bacterium]
MMSSKPEPRPMQYLIKDLEQLQALANPLHLRLLEFLYQKAMTVTQLANLMDEKPNRLYYHINKLEQVGLVQLVETRPYRSILEKYYMAVAEGFKIDESLLQLQKQNVGSLYRTAQAAFEATLEELGQTLRISLQETPGASMESAHPYMEWTHARLPRGKVKELYEKVVTLCGEFEAADQPEGDVEYSLTLLFCPVVRPEEKSPEEGKGA